MSIVLTKDQHQALASCEQSLPQVLDPTTNVTYVLVRADVYRRLLSEGVPPGGLTAAPDAAAENDPVLRRVNACLREPVVLT